MSIYNTETLCSMVVIESFTTGAKVGARWVILNQYLQIRTGWRLPQTAVVWMRLDSSVAAAGST